MIFWIIFISLIIFPIVFSITGNWMDIGRAMAAYMLWVVCWVLALGLLIGKFLF